MSHAARIWILSGVCFALAFMHPLAALLIVPAFLLYLYALTHSPSLKHVLIYSVMVGVIKAAGVLSWVWYVYPMDWLTDQTIFLQLCIIGLYWITAAFSLAFGTMFASIVLYSVYTRFTWGLFLFPIMWIIGELVGSFCFSILTLGPGSTLQTHFSYGYVGYTLSNVPVLQSVAKLGGVYTLSLLLTTLILLVYVGHQQKTKPTKVLMVTTVTIAFFCIGTALFHHQNLPQVQNMRIATTETRLDKTFMEQGGGFGKRRMLAKEITLAAMTYNVDAIILPEDMRMIGLFESPEHVFNFLRGNTARHITLIDSSRVTNTDGDVVLRNFIFNTDTLSLYTLDKNYLTPHGEYMPYLHNALLRRVASTPTRSKLAIDLSYKAGTLNDYSAIPQDSPVIISCMESAWPSATYARTKGRVAPYIAHPVSHSWFTSPTILWYQQERMLQTQAIWSNTPIISSVNMGPHSIYRPDGYVERGQLLESSTYWSIYLVEI